MTITVVVRHEPVCDFCSGQPVTARYHADDFIAQDAGSFVSESIGDWAACHLCESLIDTGRWDDLISNAVISFFAVHPEMGSLPTQAVREHFAGMYTRLRASNFRKGKL